VRLIGVLLVTLIRERYLHVSVTGIVIFRRCTGQGIEEDMERKERNKKMSKGGRRKRKNSREEERKNRKETKTGGWEDRGEEKVCGRR
jgi:hypothetical protein